MPYYPFGALAPDRNPRLNDQIMRVADGVFPTPDGYKPAGQWASVATALPGAPLGGASFAAPAGDTIIVAGTASGLYQATGDAWTLLASGYTASRWSFVQFGNKGVATNGTGPLQKIDLATMVVSDLGGDPPHFELLGTVYDGFLVGAIMDGDVLTLAWCAAYNSESWTFAQGQSDYQTLASGGRINGIISGEYGLILQRGRIMRMDYVGGNKIFNFAEVSSNIGCVTPNSVAQWGKLSFFLSEHGFVQFDGAQPTLIGRESIDVAFRTAYDSGDYAAMTCAIDPVRGVVMWSMADKVWIYDWLLQKWSTAPYAATGVFAGVTRGLVTDATNAGVSAPTDIIDASALTFTDDDGLDGGDPRLYVFSSDYRLGTFTGTPMAATFTLNDLELFAGRRADVRMVRPDIDASSGVTVTLAGKQRLADATASVATTDLRTSGDMPVRASARYHRPTVAVAAGTTWTHAKGLEVVAQPGAGR